MCTLYSFGIGGRRPRRACAPRGRGAGRGGPRERLSRGVGQSPAYGQTTSNSLPM